MEARIDQFKPSAGEVILTLKPDGSQSVLANIVLSQPHETHGSRGCNLEDLEVTTCVNVLRWDFTKRTHSEALTEIGRLAEVLNRGSEGLCNLYLRMTDMIREHKLTDAEIRKALAPHFPAPRVSEFLRIASAPQEIYMRYRAGLIGFRATLQECRGYRVTPSDELKRKKIRRTAERLVLLMGDGEVNVRGKRVTVV